MVHELELASRYGMRTEEFSALMEYRVREILLVASPYDAFVLEEDGQLTELVFQEYRNLDLNLRHVPRFARTASIEEALRILSERKVDLVVATPRLTDADVRTFARRVREEYPEMPVGVLAAHAWDLPRLEDLRASGEVDWIFLWQGDVKAILALIKQVEDRRNADHDVREAGVQAIVLVEDEVRFYSAYLPNIYTEVTTQTARLIAEGINLSHRLLRMQARPKILLAQTFEEAFQLLERYEPNVLGLISDVAFPHRGALDPEAGFELVRLLHERAPDLPVLLQSTDAGHAERADAAGAAFVHKDSPSLLEEIRHFITERFGFGDFVFQLTDGTEVGRAADMRQMLHELGRVPEESLIYHASRNHFSAWLKARTEFELAALLRPRSVEEFPSVEALRTFLVASLQAYLREIRRHVIADFDRAQFDELVAFAKLGSGSLGGKGRGLAFVHKLLAQTQVELPGVEVAIPQTVVIATDVYEDFLEENRLGGLIREAEGLDDAQVLDAFRRGRVGQGVRRDLAVLLETMTGPIAVRSSSLLEDSLYQPFAGVYATVMLPNSHPSLDVRLAQLLEAVKLVYASTVFTGARTYLAGSPHRVEEERMAVLVQRLVGNRHQDRFYPSLSGVVSSYNFYPFGDIRPEDGVALVAAGLGKSVVEGVEALRFCPRYPQILPQLSSVRDVLRNAQRRFYALDLGRDDVMPRLPVDANLVHLETSAALAEGQLHQVASTYLAADDTLVSGVVRGGTPLVTFAPLLRGAVFPFPEVLDRLVQLAQLGMGTPVELEFAADLRPGLGATQTLDVLQVRPLVIARIADDARLDPEAVDGALVYSRCALGHGCRGEVFDLVVVDPARLDRAHLPQVATVLERINRGLREAGRSSVLIGPGRWGSQDPRLGIPVVWSQIATARAIVEIDFADLEVEPSQGSHFFHNLTCFGVAYLAVHQRRDDGRVDWDWLAAQPALTEELDGTVRHLRLERPVEILVDGRAGRGVIRAAD